VVYDLAFDRLHAGLGLRSGGLHLQLRALVILVIGMARDRVLELAHPLAEGLAELGQALGTEDE
jgi:hypothetical protein